jgi:hypothetical protein
MEPELEFLASAAEETVQSIATTLGSPGNGEADLHKVATLAMVTRSAPSKSPHLDTDGAAGGGSSALSTSTTEILSPVLGIQANLAEAESVEMLSALVGKRVLLQGLVRTPEFNGEWGKVLSYEAGSKRFKVSLHRASGPPLVAKLQRKNLFLPSTVALNFTEVQTVQAMNVVPVANAEDRPLAANAYAGPTQACQASKSTLRRSVLRRAAQRRTDSDSAVADQQVAVSGNPEVECHSAPQQQPSCTPRQWVSGASKGETSVRQLRRQPSCPATPNRRQSSPRRLHRQPSCPASSRLSTSSSNAMPPPFKVALHVSHVPDTNSAVSPDVSANIVLPVSDASSARTSTKSKDSDSSAEIPRSRSNRLSISEANLATEGKRGDLRFGETLHQDSVSADVMGNASSAPTSGPDNSSATTAKPKKRASRVSQGSKDVVTPTSSKQRACESDLPENLTAIVTSVDQCSVV